MRWTGSILAAAVVTLVGGAAQGQVVKQFDKTYGGTADENFVSVLATPDGGYFLAGYSLSGAGADKTDASRGGNDFWLVKTDAAGQKQWDRAYGGTQPNGSGWIGEWLAGAALTQNGGYVLIGTSFSDIGGDKTEAGRGGGDYWVVRLDSGGNKVWDRTIGGPGFDWADGILATSDGGFLLVGSGGWGVGGEKTVGNYGGWSGHDYWIVKLDANGNKLWDTSFGGYNWDSPHAGVAELADGSYVIAGTATSPASGNKTAPSFVSWQDGDYWVVKIDPAGTYLWDKTYGGTAWEDGTKIIATSDGGFAMVGTSASDVSGTKTQPSRGGADYWLVKADTNGNQQWDATFGSSGSEISPTGLVQTADGGFLIAGSSTGPVSGEKTQAPRGGEDTWVVKTDALGHKMWDKLYGGAGRDVAASIVRTTDGGYLLGMDSTSGIGKEKSEASRGGFDYWILKIGDLALLPATLAGRSYIDVDHNCLFDATVDVPLPNRLIQASGSYFTMTGSDGRFSLRVPAGAYSLQQVTSASDPVQQTCPAGNLTASVSGAGLTWAGEFANQAPAATAAVGMNFFGVYPSPLTSPCPGQSNLECVTFSNGPSLSSVTSYYMSIAGSAGATVVPGTATAQGQCGCTPVITGNDVSCEGTSLLPPNGYCTICATVSVPSSATTPSAIDVIATTDDPAGDVGFHSDPVICSHDPNDLVLVRPASCGPSAYVPNGTDLVYRVRFQNTGNGPAHQVVVTDVLDPAVFDLSTLRVVGSSHAVSAVEVFPGNQLVLSFYGIELPPEATDPLGSIGTVLFSVKPKPGLTGPLPIANQASIVFDLNEPVITNEATATIIDNLPPVSFTPPAQVCANDAPFALSGGSPAGGTYSGPGVSGNVFDPAAAGVGSHPIRYDYTEAVQSPDYTLNQVGAFAPLPGVGAGLSLGDDMVTAPLPLGFAFTFYGNTYSQVYLSSNGFLTFNGGSGNGCCQGQHLPGQLPNPSNLISFAWNDLYPPGGGSVDFLTTGTAPNRIFALNYRGVPVFGNAASKITTQVLLYEGTNVIEIHTTAAGSGNGMTMGIENDGGTLATAVPGRNADAWSITDDFVQFIPPASAQLCSDSASRTIQVDPAPLAAITASGPTSMCGSGSVTLTASGGAGYLWSTGATTASIVVTAPGTYSVQAVNAEGCASTAQITISAAADGDPCDDGHACTVGDTCQAGACVPGALSSAPACAPTCATLRRGLAGTVEDTHIADDKPTRNYGTSGSLTAGTVSPGVRQSLVRFDLSAIPQGSLVTSATATFNAILGGGAPLRAHVVTAPWSEASVTWASFGGAFLPAVAATFPAVTANLPAMVPTSADVRALVQSWVSGAVPNHGVLIERDLNGSTSLGSSELSTPTARPQLSICWVAPPG